MEYTLTELKGQIDSSSKLVNWFNIPLSIMDKTSIQKVSRKIEDLNKTINTLEQICIEHFSQSQWNAHSSQVCMGHFPEKPVRPQM